MKASKSYKYETVIWDWNGTLFNDVEWCITVLNTMLSKRDLKPVVSISEYHSVFCFPVIEYYRNVGFDFSKEPFEDLAVEFIDLYHSGDIENCTLFPYAERVLSEIKDMGVSQVILSASKMELLELQVSRYSLGNYFDELLGISNIYAASKIDVGLEYMKRNNSSDVVLIGDTKHDYEVAQAIGADCILIPNGHQSRETLLSCGVLVLDDITDVPVHL